MKVIAICVRSGSIVVIAFDPPDVPTAVGLEQKTMVDATTALAPVDAEPRYVETNFSTHRFLPYWSLPLMQAFSVTFPYDGATCRGGVQSASAKRD